MMIRILIADDHQIVRDGLKALLSGIPEISIVGEAADGDELFIKLKIIEADIVLLDISMPGLSGIEICRELSSAYPGLKVVILSMYSSEEFVFQAFRAGASGYLPKNISRQELIDAIQKINFGEEYISPSLSSGWANNLMKRAKEKPLSDPEVLSRRELEILKLCAEGMTNKDISEKLFISIRTVESHKNHIMQKLDLRTTADMVKFALRNNIIDM
ncbi:MAG: response regulator transcription factor [Bacteroidetes bacterium]|nr:response regulator transcription factor [Bacteroidota bacterium]